MARMASGMETNLAPGSTCEHMSGTPICLMSRSEDRQVTGAQEPCSPRSRAVFGLAWAPPAEHGDPSRTVQIGGA